MSTDEGAPKIPPPRDDDPEEVADKLSIAVAMWARNERADALNWLRRAAESASDAEADVRALELAKAASALAAMVTSMRPPPSAGLAAATPASAPPAAAPAPPPAAANAPAPRPSAAPVRPPASRPAPKPSGRPPSMGKLAPLPPIRPLGTAPPQPQRPARRPDARPEGARKESPSSSSLRAAPQAASSSQLAATHAAASDGDHEPPMDHEQTSQMPAAAAMLLARSEVLEAAADATPAAPEESELLETMRREVGDDAPAPPQNLETKEIATPSPSANAESPAEATPKAAGAVDDPSDRLTAEPSRLPLSVGMRVRVFAEGGSVFVVPENEAGEGGIAALLMPLHADDDMRSVFGRPRRDG